MKNPYKVYIYDKFYTAYYSDFALMNNIRSLKVEYGKENVNYIQDKMTDGEFETYKNRI